MATLELRTGPLPPRDVEAVRDLARRAADADGVSPLDDDARLGLTLAHAVPRLHALALPDGPGTGPDLLGYLQLDPASGGLGLVVDPTARRRGIGSALLAAAEGARPAQGALSGWAHGALAAALAFGDRHGFTRARELLQLRRDLTAPIPAAVPPAGIRLRPFVRGRDEDGWLRLNAAAFAGLPDQAGLTRADLDARLDEPWADTAGFLLAEDVSADPRPGRTDEQAGELVGFHWTKVHDRTEDDPAPAGEVYALGVAPGRQGIGLGAVLLHAGLAHLRARGLRRALLYVDADNPGAVRLYERSGFVRWRTDVQLTRVPSAG